VQEKFNSGENAFIMSGNYYFCTMIRIVSLSLFILIFSAGNLSAQSFVKTSDILKRSDLTSNTGQLRIVQDPALDTLLNRYILGNQTIYRDYGRYGMEGFRIQIYSSSNRNAREESNKARLEFMSKFPEIVSYALYAEPGYFKIRAGDFRTKTEATKIFQIVSREFPDAYLVPDIINFPDLNKN
jgi:hypothetical protein